MRLRVRHRLHWDFEEPASMSVHALRLTPHDRAGLTICHWRIAGDRAAPMPGYEDGYGNATLILTRNQPHRGITVTVDGEVETIGNGGSLAGIEETLPPAVFCRESLATAQDAAIVALRRPGERPAALVARLRELVTLDPEGPVEAAAVAAGQRGRPAGLLHLVLAVLRAGDVPARFVSGYVWPGRDGVETTAPHAWVEWWNAGAGAWAALEVLGEGEVGQGHLRLAIGLDESEAGPARGFRRGPGAERFAHSIRVDAA